MEIDHLELSAYSIEAIQAQTSSAQTPYPNLLRSAAFKSETITRISEG